MKRLSVRFDCPSCGFAAPAAIEIREELSDRWLEVRAAGFQSHLRDGGATGEGAQRRALLEVRATRAEARRTGDTVAVRGLCPGCGSAINLPVGA